MQVSEIQFEGQPPIESYGGGGFRISGMFRAGGLIITPTRIDDWAASEVLSPADFAAPIAEAAQIDVLLIGVGADIAPLPADVRHALDEADLGYDAMATGAACRTYNVLLAEDRRVAAALIAV